MVVDYRPTSNMFVFVDTGAEATAVSPALAEQMGFRTMMQF